MAVFKTRIILKAAILFTLLALSPVQVQAAGDTTYTLENGMTVILKENHNSSMVSSIIFVRSGSKYESRYENGITHFLEHLLFDGTVNLKREELDRSVRDLGGYINAFTRKEMTAYLVLLPGQFIDYGLTVQADMLFNSVFPEEELAKERKVVIEEIKRDADSPGAPAEKFFTEKAYAGTDYDRPVLGFQAFVENIPREAIIDYWRRYYIPENMTILLIGDFESEQMKSTVEQIFGGLGPSMPVDTTAIDSTLVTARRAEREWRTRTSRTFEGEEVFKTVADVTTTYIDFSFRAPSIDSSDYMAIDLLSQYLAMDGVSPLMKALKEGENPLATEASVSLLPYEEFSRLEISVITENPDNADSIVALVTNQIANTGTLIVDPETITGIKTSNKCDEIYNAEKLHYYGFMIAPYMMTGGWDFIQNYAANLERVEWANCQAAAKKWFGKPSYAATVVKPAAEGATDVYRPQEMSAKEILKLFGEVTYPEYQLDSGFALTFPSTDSISYELSDAAEYHQEVLANGLTLIIKSNPDSRVFALNVLGKNRTANESELSAGVTDFVNRCIEKGTVTRDVSELSRDLAKIGANVTLYDNPWIPFDDRYTTRRFSFMKFETIDEFAEKGFHLFAEMILYPAFDSTEVENVRRSMIGTLRRAGASPSNLARDLFYETLFAGKDFARPIMGSPATIGMLTPYDLKRHHERFYAPGNVILSITTARPVDEVKAWVSKRFGRLGDDITIETPPSEAPEPIFEIKDTHKDLDKEQVKIYLGAGLPGAGSSDLVAIKVATSILSNRLFQNLREKQGLAYSVGAGSTFDREFGWLYAAIGTGTENFQKAVDGILLEMDKLRLDGPMPSEVTTARNQIWGRLMSARLSGINQAYYLGVNAYLGRDYSYTGSFLEQLAKVTVEDVRRVAAKYFKTDAYVLATAGRRP